VINRVSVWDPGIGLRYQFWGSPEESNVNRQGHLKFGIFIPASMSLSSSYS